MTSLVPEVALVSSCLAVAHTKTASTLDPVMDRTLQHQVVTLDHPDGGRAADQVLTHQETVVTASLVTRAHQMVMAQRATVDPLMVAAATREMASTHPSPQALEASTQAAEVPGVTPMMVPPPRVQAQIPTTLALEG